MGYKIERGIPVPERRPNARYPWREMKVRESFLVKDRTYNQVINAAVGIQRRTKLKFYVKDLRKSVRVWRVK